MYALTKQNDDIAYNIREYVCDTEEDIASIPTDCAPGSSLVVIETGNIYLLNTSFTWELVPGDVGTGNEQNLAGLTDVEISTPSEGQGLVYDSVLGKWKNEAITLAASDITSGTFALERGGTGKTQFASTNYSTIEYRGESLNSSETTPTSNGTICWTYE